jgi:hypothetical protein
MAEQGGRYRSATILVCETVKQERIIPLRDKNIYGTVKTRK